MRSLFCPPFTLIRNRGMSFDALVRPFDGAMPSMWNGLRWSFRQPTIVTGLILAAISGICSTFQHRPSFADKSCACGTWRSRERTLPWDSQRASRRMSTAHALASPFPAFSYAARGTTKLMLVGPHLATRDSRGGRLPSGCGRLPAAGHDHSGSAARMAQPVRRRQVPVLAGAPNRSEIRVIPTKTAAATRYSRRASRREKIG